jgi:glycosyltransferase involved in cell wall biosynthesis
MKLSVLVIAYNMRREIPRALMSLGRDYQRGIDDLDYEVLVLDNNSSEPLDKAVVEGFGPEFRYHFLEGAPPSPAYAINYGASRASGDVLCLMIDGAHILTPGVLRLGMAAYRAFRNPVVLTRYFFLGPGSQNDTILDGYCQEVEDGLLDRIEWPGDGYRLFEIGAAFQGAEPNVTWFNRMFESNCLFMSRRTFETIGGADERFDYPGGGFLNIDLFIQSSSLEDVEPVQLVGEGSFHQVHGGTTTNVEPELRESRVEQYKAQYREIRGGDAVVTEEQVYYLGHIPTERSKIHRYNHRAKRQA